MGQGEGAVQQVMYSFGERSRRELATCKKELRSVMELAIKRSAVDFGITQGERTVEEQKRFFLQGASKIDPDRYTPQELVKKAKHIVNEFEPKSRAVDIYIFVKGRKDLAFDERYVIYVAGVIESCARELGVPMRWGGNWDMDGEIITDQRFQDLVHFELL